MGHSLVALREGVKVRSITLFLMGGVARVERECSTAMGSLRVAAAGPAVSLILGLILLVVSHPGNHVSPLLGNLLAQLGWLNLVLAIFNLLPGLPLDGGLILKSLVWQWTGSQRRGIQGGNREWTFPVAVRDHARLLDCAAGRRFLRVLAGAPGLVRDGCLAQSDADAGPSTGAQARNRRARNGAAFSCGGGRSELAQPQPNSVLAPVKTVTKPS